MAVHFKDYYAALGVPVTATEDDLKQAFRTLARKYHPDVAKDPKTAEEKFKEINEANEILSHADSRAKYDVLYTDWKNGGSTATGADPRVHYGPSRSAGTESSGFRFEGTGFSDFFEQFFGGRQPHASGAHPGSDDPRQGPPLARRGPDAQGDILISLNEVLTGTTRSISIRHLDPVTGTEATTTYPVRIPAGVPAGHTLRVAGKGGPGEAGGPPGDILLRVHYAQHPDWEARGADLVGGLALAPWEAVLGATVTIPTLDGPVTLKVPAGTQPGHQLRVRGRGLPAGSSPRGHIQVVVSIAVPATISPAEAALWQQLAQASAFVPRPPT
jgi:curved DNA-binding protein